MIIPVDETNLFQAAIIHSYHGRIPIFLSALRILLNCIHRNISRNIWKKNGITEAGSLCLLNINR